MFSALPVRASWRGSDRETSAAAVSALPALGLVLGALAGLLSAVVLGAHAGFDYLSALIGIAALAVLTRGLHLDGLADLADGLGSRAPAARAREIMRRSDIGPFGVITLVLVLGIDASCLSTVVDYYGTWAAVGALAVVACAGRVAVVLAALPGIPPAEGSAFGSLVTGSQSVATAAAWTAGAAGIAALTGYALGASAVGWAAAVLGSLVAGWFVRRHAERRLGGVSGDVFGALIELVTAACLFGLALAT